MNNIFLAKRIGRAVLYVILTLLAVYTLMPMLFLLLNSFKGQAEIVRNPLAMPAQLTFQYVGNAFGAIHFPRAIGYTVLITVVSLALIVLFSSLCGWVVTRHKSKWSTAIYLMFVAAMLIPFQAVMYPLMGMMDSVGLKKCAGADYYVLPARLSLSVFLYSGFFKSVPRGVEEAALIDGANHLPDFFYHRFSAGKGNHRDCADLERDVDMERLSAAIPDTGHIGE